MLNRSQAWAVALLAAAFVVGVMVGAGGEAAWARHAHAADPGRGRGLERMTANVVLAAQQPPLKVTLAEAVRRALEVQPAVIQARGDVRNASAGERAAWGAFLPTITSSSSAARSNVGHIDQTTGRPVAPEYTYTVGLNASLDLFNGFRREANQRAAAATSDAADAGFVTTRYETIFGTQQLFYNPS